MERDIITNNEIDFHDGKFHFVIADYDIAKIIKFKGIKWTRNDIDSANAGRTLDGDMNRGRVCQKIKMEISCIDVTQPTAVKLLNIINPEYVVVHYFDPLFGERIVQFYSNNVPATFCGQATDESLLWCDLSFPLVER